ncbi:hypothetical protein ACJX0J_036751, partial [Zea mays]
SRTKTKILCMLSKDYLSLLVVAAAIRLMIHLRTKKKKESNDTKNSTQQPSYVRREL